MPEKKSRPSTPVLELVLLVKVGSLVSYYLEGWRYGYLEGVKGKLAKVRPIGPHGKPMRLVTVGIDDLKEIS